MADELDPIEKLAVGLFFNSDKVPTLDCETFYAVDEATEDVAIDCVTEFVWDCLGTGSWELLQRGWQGIDLTRMTIACMISMLAGSHLVRPKDLLPERPLFVQRCQEELRRRGESEERLRALLGGLDK